MEHKKERPASEEGHKSAQQVVELMGKEESYGSKANQQVENLEMDLENVRPVHVEMEHEDTIEGKENMLEIVSEAEEKEVECS